MNPKANRLFHIRFLLVAALSAALLPIATGCALTRTETKLGFTPAIERPVGPQPKAALEIGEIIDKRPVKDKAVVVHKVNGYGQTMSGAYISARPVAEVFREGVIGALQRNGFTGTQPVNYELRGSIEEFGFDAITGFWKATVMPKLTVRFELLEKLGGQSVWRETYFGRDTLETAWGNAEFVALMFSKSAEDVLRQLLNDRSFRSHFESGSAISAQK